MASAPLGRAFGAALGFRAMAAMVAFIVGWLVAGVASAAEPADPPTQSVQVHAYEGVNHTAARVCGSAERGPPPTYDLDAAAYNADDPRSLGASMCPDQPTTATTYAYDGAARFVRRDSGTTGPEGAGGLAPEARSSRARSGVAAKAVPQLPPGYPSFTAAKRAMGSPGKGNVYDHVVEQSQIARSGFSPRDIHNPFNMNPVSARANQLKANYYSSKQGFTGGKTVRDWLTGQSYADQYSFGMDVLTQIRRGTIP